MEEIKAGDFVAFDGHEGLWRVEHIMGEWCWIFKDAFSRSGQLAHIKRLTKEEKFFEAGKMYKNKYGKTFECVNVVKRNEKNTAFGFIYWKEEEYDVDNFAGVAKDYMGTWEELTDD